MIILDQPPAIVIPKPAIIRPQKHWIPYEKATFPFPMFSPTGGAGIVGPVVTFRGVGNSGDSFSIGAAAADRVVVALVSGVRGAATPRTITSITFDGATGTSPTTTGVGSTNAVTVGASSKLITTGTTVTMVTNYSGGVLASKVAVYTITGQATNTPGDTKSWKTGDAAVTINVANAGCVFMVAAGCDGSAGIFTLTGVNKDDDQAASVMQTAVGSVSNLAAEAARALSATNSNTVKAFAAHTYS